MTSLITQRDTKAEVSGSLIAFTTLAPLSVGGMAGLLLIRSDQPLPGVDSAAIMVFIVGFLALMFSMSHLGRPWRAPLAILHLSSSWLSREVILFSIFLFTLFCFALLPSLIVNRAAIQYLGWISVIFGLASTIATGKTYHLRARPSWDNRASMLSFPLGSLSAGILFGFFLEFIFSGTQSIGYPTRIMVTVFLALAIFASLLRNMSNLQGSPEAISSRTLAVGPYLWVLVIRVITGLLAMVMIWIPEGAIYIAWLPALVGEFTDRSLFFHTAVPVTLAGRYT